MLPKRFQQVGLLTNDIISQRSIDEFVWLYKLDGERKVVLIYDGVIKEVYISDNEYKFNVIGTISISDISPRVPYVFDTEFYNNTYYIFDVIYFVDDEHSNLNYIKRMKLIENINLPNIMKVKPYYYIKDWDKLIEIVNTSYHDPDGNDIDGIIVQVIDLPYNTKQYISYKLKRRIMNTIDFYVHESRLYLTNRTNDKIVKNFDEKVLNINLNGVQLSSFTTPFYKDLGIYNDSISYMVRSNKDLISDYPLKYQKEILIAIDKNIEDKIYEFGFIEYEGRVYLIPIRERVDKPYPNSYRVGLCNLETYFNPLSTSNTTYFQKQDNPDRSIINLYHDMSHAFRDAILNNLISHLNKLVNRTNDLNIFDLCGGRGGDIFKLSSLVNIKNLMVEDADKNALVSYFNRVKGIIKGQGQGQGQGQERRRKTRRGKEQDFKMRIIDIPLSTNNDDIIKMAGDITYDLIIMNFAIHYLCTDIKNIDKLIDLVSLCLKSNGLFMVTYYDGEKILKLLGDNNEMKFGKLKIEIVKRDGETVIANMPLPTISSTGFRTEPLTTNYYLSLLNSTFKLIESKYVYEFAKIDDIKNKEDVIDIFKLVKMNIYALK